MAEDKGKAPAAKDAEWGPDQAAFLPSWDFGKPFVGTILSSRMVENVAGLGGTARDVPIFTVVDEQGERWSIWGSGMLSRVLPEHVSHFVRITDKGLDPQGDGTSLRIFDVRCKTDAAKS